MTRHPDDLDLQNSRKKYTQYDNQYVIYKKNTKNYGCQASNVVGDGVEEEQRPVDDVVDRDGVVPVGVAAGHGVGGVAQLLQDLKGSGRVGGGEGVGGKTMDIDGYRVVRDGHCVSLAVLVVILCDRFSNMTTF